MKNKRRFAVAIVLMAALVSLTGCGNEKPLIYIGEGTWREKEIDCTVAYLYWTNETERDVDFNYGMGYGSDGKTGGYYISPDYNTTSVSHYYVILEDESGNALRFEVEGKDWEMLHQGNAITLTLKTEYMADGQPSGIQRFYWGSSEFEYDSNVTVQMQQMKQKETNMQE